MTKAARTSGQRRKPTPIDVYLGKRIRARRLELGTSQTALGDKIGVTFQQLQKYENGTNRVSAAALVEIANHLETSVAWLTEGAPGAKASKSSFSTGGDFLCTRDGAAIVRAFASIKSDEDRRTIAEIVVKLAEMVGGRSGR
jgi:transcriptional regulator with XRE-family HTH domain